MQIPLGRQRDISIEQGFGDQGPAQVAAALPVAFDGVKLDTSGKELAQGLAGEGHVRQEQIYSPRLKKNIGCAWLPVAHAGSGTTLTVVKKPFVDPEKEIPKSWRQPPRRSAARSRRRARSARCPPRSCPPASTRRCRCP